MSKLRKQGLVMDIYDSGILSSGPAITYTIDGKIVRTSDDE